MSNDKKNRIARNILGKLLMRMSMSLSKEDCGTLQSTLITMGMNVPSVSAPEVLECVDKLFEPITKARLALEGGLPLPKKLSVRNKHSNGCAANLAA